MCSISLTIEPTTGLEEEIECLQNEKDQLSQEHARVLESKRKVGEELKTRNRELTGKICFDSPNMNSLLP